MAATAVIQDAVSEPVGGDTLFEVIDGDIVELPPMGVYECWIASILQRLLGNFATEHQCGRAVTETLFDFSASVGRKRRPDVAFVSYGRWPKGKAIPRVQAWDVVPDLAVEVISSSNLADEIVDRVADYFEAGVQTVWLVFPSQRLVYVYSSPKAVVILDMSDELQGEPAVPGFRMRVTDLFEETSEAE